MSSFWDSAATIASVGLYNPGAEDATDAQIEAQNRAVEEQRRQFDLTRGDLLPYLNAGTNAIGQYTQGINGAPTAPSLRNLQQLGINAPTLNAFNQTPTVTNFTGNTPVSDFNFDVNQAMNNPAIQFQLQQGQQQLDRVAGKNRNLGSGARLAAAQEFGQGLASQAINDEFNRQLTSTQQNNAAAGQRFNQGLATNQQQNALANQNFSNLLNLNQYQNNQAVTQYGLDREYQNDLNNTLLQNYGLQNDAYNSRLNRLAGLIDVGRGTGTTLGAAGQQTANNVSQAYQNIGDINAAQATAPINTFLSFLNTGANAYGAFNGA